MKSLTDREIVDLRYFILFCDGIHDTGKRSHPLLSGSGLGHVGYLGDVFRDQPQKNTIMKAVRRGLVDHATSRDWWTPTDAGRAITEDI